MQVVIVMDIMVLLLVFRYDVGGAASLCLISGS